MHLNSKYAATILAAALLTACGNGQGASAPKAQSPAPKAAQNQAAPQAATAVVEKTRTPLENGAKIAKQCKICHSFEDGGANKVGPNLWGIIGSKAASKDGFKYSKAMTEANITWDEASLEAYITKPKEFVPGTRMAFVGVKKEQDRADLLAYIKEKTTP